MEHTIDISVTLSPHSFIIATLKNWSLVLYGTASAPYATQQHPRPNQPHQGMPPDFNHAAPLSSSHTPAHLVLAALCGAAAYLLTDFWQLPALGVIDSIITALGVT